MGNPFSHAPFGHLHTGQGQVNQLNPPPLSTQTTYQLQVAAASQGCFKCKVFALIDAGFNFFQEESAGVEQFTPRCQWRQPGGNQVSVDKPKAVSNLRQILQREGCLTRAVRPCNDPASGHQPSRPRCRAICTRTCAGAVPPRVLRALSEPCRLSGPKTSCSMRLSNFCSVASGSSDKSTP